MDGAEVGIATQALDGETHCGDIGACWEHEGSVVICMVDGLGHGSDARAAAAAAVNYVAKHLSEPLVDVFTGCNRAIRSTRGVAMGIAVIDPKSRTLTHAGVGNTRALIAGNTDRLLPSTAGVVGAGFKTLSPNIVPIDPSEIIVLFTDGLPEALDMSRFEEVVSSGVQELAEQIIRAHHPSSDDTGVLVYRP